MAKAHKLPSGNWRVQVSTGEKDANGKYKYISITSPTEKEANYSALEYELKHKEISRDSSNMTLQEAIDRYIETKDTVLSPSTVREYRQEQRNSLQGLMNIKLGKITQEMIQREINKESKNHSPKTVRNIHGLLSAVLREYRPDFTLKTVLPQKARTFIKIPELEEIEKIMSAIKDTNIELPVLMALCLGMRRSEICGLKWDCIDLKRNQIIIKSAIVIGEDGKPHEKMPKSYAGNRILPIPKCITELLRSKERIGDYVVPQNGNQIYKSFKRVLKNNNIEHIRFHDLRHANASLMLVLNIPDKYAMERMGHSTNSTLKNVYQHTITKERDLINNRINDYFDNILKK